MAMGEDRFGLVQGKFLARKFRESATADLVEQHKNDYFAGYAESFLMQLAVQYPDVRREMEERILYRDCSK